ncbi:hypothetical protein TSOC_000036 [Tetrabaena socialis]|uniref:Uncharacterized protein n=1 Tax=Tetrabaena socialis TaxID=47790 RepID=A0A2J8AKD9_9CHLO|nr:hypothetical protein TSOC_000036 [Tetrabaena socialis]|eukprot:PNH12975.1 hypothetical protein TSOC_000036 [Tetrabaena socialis]
MGAVNNQEATPCTARAYGREATSIGPTEKIARRRPPATATASRPSPANQPHSGSALAGAHSRSASTSHSNSQHRDTWSLAYDVEGSAVGPISASVSMRQRCSGRSAPQPLNQM